MVWQEADTDGDGVGIFGQRVDASGNLVGAVFQANTHTTADQARPDVHMRDDGRFVVVWVSNGQDGSGNGVFSQRFGANGTPLGSEFQLNTTTMGNQISPAVAGAPNGGFLIGTWGSYNLDGSFGGIGAQLFDGDGNKIGPELLVNTVTAGPQMLPSVAANNRNFVSTWDDLNGLDGSSAGIFGALFKALPLLFFPG